ncbi:hypothetical protein SGGMMB4_02696 [Sodalis glossinidius str. 'morsitans']|uniref:Hypothetical phage protein n=1 Tax=Sodalis glossinidius (strain morsitans) TaxID=343509 RepID=Q2NTR6_SODGM|nr:hypothetical protein [Sodalis glossinidius]BAE74459.1 hypothetical phage protein [Sodalis glossinidius str. 'morsitans']CRL45150.1 hypothetical protein SGGMMB4_02696 [Sodalis glossinidius str. 'morsitans']
MGQVAFDTLKFVETLETAGLPKDQAKAISLAVRESHEAADVATKRDLEDAKKDVLSEVTAVKRDLEDVRKEIEFRFEKTDTQIADARKETATQIALLRKDVESISTWLLIKMAAMMTALLGIAVTLVKILI